MAIEHVYNVAETSLTTGGTGDLVLSDTVATAVHRTFTAGLTHDSQYRYSILDLTGGGTEFGIGTWLDNAGQRTFRRDTIEQSSNSGSPIDAPVTAVVTIIGASPGRLTVLETLESTYATLADLSNYATLTNLNDHVTDASNPHSVTAAQVGADPVGTAATAVTAHETTFTHSNLPTSNQKAALDATPNTPNAGNAYATLADVVGSGEANTSTTPAPIGSNEADINMAKTAGGDLQKRKLSGTTTIGITQTADSIQYTVQPGSISQTYLSATYALEARTITGTNSVTGGGDLSANRTLTLVNDIASPGANQVYGTDGFGTRGWKADPAVGGGITLGSPFVDGNMLFVSDQNAPGEASSADFGPSSVALTDQPTAFTDAVDFQGGVTENGRDLVAVGDTLSQGVASSVTTVNVDTLPGNTWAPNPIADNETQFYALIGTAAFTLTNTAFPNTDAKVKVADNVGTVNFVGWRVLNSRTSGRTNILRLTRVDDEYQADWG